MPSSWPPALRGCTAQGACQSPSYTPCHPTMIHTTQAIHVIHPAALAIRPMHPCCIVAQSAHGSTCTQVAISHLLYTYMIQHDSLCPSCSTRSAESYVRLSTLCGEGVRSWPHLPKVLSNAAWRRACRCRRASSPKEACCATPGVPPSRNACSMLPWLTIASGRKAGSQNYTHPDMPGYLPNTLRSAPCTP